MIISYEDFSKKLKNKIASGETLIKDLVETVIDNPNRYTGIFRVSNVKTKLIQNVTQSNEIKFGDFMEEIVTEYIARIGFVNHQKALGVNEDGDDLNADQMFSDELGNMYLVEQKIRDDHDSTKKRGQFQNFEKKVRLLKQKYPTKNLIAVMWFIDDGLTKNKNFYYGEMSALKIPNAQLYVLYGKDFFVQILKNISAWNELTGYLLRNKLERSNEIISIPDFDTSPEVLYVLNRLSLSHKRKLLSEKPEYVQLRKELFSTGFNLKKMK